MAPSVIGTVLFCDLESGVRAAYLCIDLSAVASFGEGQQMIGIDDHLLQNNARRLEVDIRCANLASNSSKVCCISSSEISRMRW
jgi:hypothetical protein